MSASSTVPQPRRRFLRLPRRVALPATRGSQLVLLLALSLVSLLLFLVLPVVSLSTLRAAASVPAFDPVSTAVLRNHSFALATAEHHGISVTPVLLLPLSSATTALAANLRCHLARVVPHLAPVVVAYDPHTTAWATRRGHAVVQPPATSDRGTGVRDPGSDQEISRLLLAAFHARLDVLLLDAAALPCTDFTFRLRQELLLQRPLPTLMTSATTQLGSGGGPSGCGFANRAFILARRDRKLRRMLRHLAREGDSVPFVDCQRACLGAASERMDCDVHGARMAVLSRPFFPPSAPSAWRRAAADSLAKACVSGHFALWRAPEDGAPVEGVYERGGVWLARNVSIKCERLLGPPCKFCGHEQR